MEVTLLWVLCAAMLVLGLAGTANKPSASNTAGCDLVKWPTTMPETTFHIPSLLNRDDADAVMFELQDLPCVNQADVDLAARTAWVSHTTMISPDDVAAALAEAGHPPDSWTD